jgi:hypothetical protein
MIVSGVRGALAYGSSLGVRFLAGLKRILEVVEKKGDLGE